MTGYDGHFIIKDLGKRGRITLLLINKGEYISFTLYNNETNIKFRFIDSFRFLEELASTLLLEKFQNLNYFSSNPNDYSLNRLIRKGLFCNEYINSWEKLHGTYFYQLINSIIN